MKFDKIDLLSYITPLNTEYNEIEVKYILKKYQHSLRHTDLDSIDTELQKIMEENHYTFFIANKLAILKRIMLEWWSEEYSEYITNDFFNRNRKKRFETVINYTFNELKYHFHTLNEAVFYVPFEFIVKSKSGER